MSQHSGHQINLDGLIGDLDDLFTEVDLDLLARRGLEPDSGQRPGPFLLTQGRHGPLQGPQVDMDPSGGQFLLNDDGVSLGNGTEELVDFTERGAVEAPRRKTFLKADLRQLIGGLIEAHLNTNHPASLCRRSTRWLRRNKHARFFHYRERNILPSLNNSIRR